MLLWCVCVCVCVCVYAFVCARAFETLVIQHEKRMRRVILPSVACQDSTTFFHSMS